MANTSKLMTVVFALLFFFLDFLVAAGTFSSLFAGENFGSASGWMIFSVSEFFSDIFFVFIKFRLFSLDYSTGSAR